MLWLPEELETDPPRGRAAIVVDVIRATTSIATAFAAGAARVIPVPSVGEAREEAARDGEALPCGERRVGCFRNAGAVARRMRPRRSAESRSCAPGGGGA